MQNTPQQLTEAIFSWQHPTHTPHLKTARWYVVSTIVLIAVVVWSVLPGRWFGDSNYLFAIFLVLFYLVVLLFENRPPVIIDFVITPDGVKSGEQFYRYDNFRDFFVIYHDDGVKRLYFEFKNPFRGRLAVPLDGQDPVEIRRFLLQFLREEIEREAEPISDQLRKWLKL